MPVAPQPPDADARQAQRVAALARRLQVQEGPVESRQTHISRLLLTPRRVWKFKRPLRLSFADFTELATRRLCCEEELRLNRRLAPSLYLDARPVLLEAQGPRIGAAGEPAAAGAVDWVVEMRRFAPGQEADALLRAGVLQPADIDGFARRIAHFHRQAPTAQPDSPHGTPQAMQVAVQTLLRALHQAASHGREQDRLARLSRWFAQRQPAEAALRASRHAQGRVRECHGDLHLANVVRLDGELTAFDGIEFDPALRWIDPVTDLAFFTMDLSAHGRPDLAWRFLDGWLEVSGDPEGLALLRHDEVYRALVRHLAARLRGGAATGPDYLGWALRRAEAPARPRLVITHGLSGSGKSTAALALLQSAGAVRLRSDVERKRLFGLAAQARSAEAGLDIYTPEAGARTFDELRRCAGLLLGAGLPVIVDAAFLRRHERDGFAALAREAGVPFAILHCRADAAALRSRVVQRQAGGQDASEAGPQVLARQQGWAEALAPQELARTVALDTGAPWAPEALWARIEALDAGQAPDAPGVAS